MQIIIPQGVEYIQQDAKDALIVSGQCHVRTTSGCPDVQVSEEEWLAASGLSSGEGGGGRRERTSSGVSARDNFTLSLSLSVEIHSIVIHMRLCFKLS